MARRPTGPLRVHLHAQARLLAKSGRGLLFQTCPLRPAPHPCRIQTRTKGPHHGCHGSLQPEPRRSYMVLQARKGRAIGFELWKRSTRPGSRGSMPPESDLVLPSVLGHDFANQSACTKRHAKLFYRERTLNRFVASLLAILILGSVATAQDKPPTKAIFLLNWYVYSEHAPFFLGLERGYFSQEGIDLQIQEGRGSVPTVQAVAGGTADFGY